MPKLSKRHFCFECGYEVTARIWTQHLEGPSHAMSIKDGKWFRAILEEPHFNSSGQFETVERGWFDVFTNTTGRAIKVDQALLVAKDKQGSLTIYSVTSQIKVFPADSKWSIIPLHVGYTLPHECKGVIPCTFVACGEDPENYGYCSKQCEIMGKKR